MLKQHIGSQIMAPTAMSLWNNTLQKLPSFVDGMPSNLRPRSTLKMSIMWTRQPLSQSHGKTVSTIQLLPFSCFHINFGLMRATDTNFGNNTPQNKTPTQQVITSIHGYVAYLIIVDAKTRYTWIFSQNLNIHLQKLSPRFYKILASTKDTAPFAWIKVVN